MAKKSTAAVEKPAPQTTAMEQFRGTVSSLTQEFKAALPPQIPVDRFVRTLLTTVQMNPQLLSCDRKSVLATCMRAAQDGLLLDGREAAPVIFNTKDGKMCQYLPMVAGILKRMRNSGEIASASANSVHEKDLFEYELGDNERIIHRPFLGGDRGPLTAVYAIVRTKDGGVYREVMSRVEIEKVRAVSKAKDSGPWQTWYEEMAEKTVLKRIAKRAPSSADIERIIDHDNEITGFVQHPPSSHEGGADRKPSYLSEVVGREGEQEPDEAQEDPKYDKEAVATILREAPDKQALETAWKENVKGVMSDEDAMEMSDIYNARLAELGG